MIPFEKSEAETRERGAVLSPSCAQRKCIFFVAQGGSASRGRRSPLSKKRFATLGSSYESSFAALVLCGGLTGHGATAFLLHCHASAYPVCLPRMPCARPQRRALLRTTCQGRRQTRRRTRGQGEGCTRCTPPPGARDDRAARLRRPMADATEALHPPTPLLSRVFEAGEADGSDGCGPHRPSPRMRKAPL